jgi:hypothetical protein
MVYAHGLEDYVVQFMEQGMMGIGSEELFVALGFALDQARLLQAVEFYTDGIGTFSKFRLQTPQPSGVLPIDEELHQKLNTGFRGNQRFQHGIAK